MTTHTQDIIHRLLNGECSEADLKALREDREAAAILDIVLEAGTLDIPAGLSNQEAWDRIKARLQPQPTIRSIRPLAWIGSVAAVILVLALFFWPSNDAPPSWATVAGERMDIDLMDGSHVILNAGSQLSVIGDWEDSRTVSLEGTALFEVSSGDKFVVQTAQGEVQVLGTSFEVTADESDYIVRCFEGSVSVSSPASEPHIIVAGQGIRLMDNQWEDLEVQEDQPSWTNGTTSFENAPIREVLNAYERQFGISIEYHGDNRNYTGAFPNDQAEEALELIIRPMGLGIESSDDESVRLRKLQE